MNLYQAGYFRRGRQGSNAGWGIVSPSKGMSQIAKDGFKGIAAKLVELKGVGGMPTVSTGIFMHERFVYLMHVNYTAKGDDARGVTFVHGYCFNFSDYYELCSKPEILCGISEDNFLMEYDESVSAYPVAEGFSYNNLDFEQLLAKYGLNDEEYKKLVFGAINALENYSNPLCIKLSLPSEQYMQASRELLYLIMMGLPYHLRTKVSFISFNGKGAAIYLSDHVEGNNYIDLDNREFAVDATRLTQFYFTKIYNTIPAADYRKRDSIFQAIAEFMNASFENPLRDVNCAQIESGFQAKIKKNDGEGIPSEVACELMAAFLKNSLTDHNDVYEYLAELIRVINQASLFITDDKVRKQIAGLYSKTEREDYKREMHYLISREVLNQEPQKGYERLNQLCTASKEQYDAVCEDIKKKNLGFYEDYYRNSYLPFTLTSLEKFEKYLIRQDYYLDGEYKVLLQLLENLMQKEMRVSSEYDQLLQTREKVKSILNRFPRELEGEIDSIWMNTHFTFWNSFPISEFDIGLFGKYRELKVEELADKGWMNQECPIAVKVMNLMELFEEEDWKTVRDKLLEVLFTDDILDKTEDKKYIQEIFFSNKMDSIPMTKPAGFDCMLAMFYDCKTKQFHMINWGKQIYKKYPDAFGIKYVTKIKDYSQILKDDQFSEKILEKLEEDIKVLKKSDKNNVTKGVIKGLKAYYDSLCGKELKSDDDLDAMQAYVNALHRLGIGALILYTAGALLRFGGKFQMIEGIGFIGSAPAIFLIVFLMLFLLVAAFKIYFADGIDGLADASGIIEMSQHIIYLVLALVLLAGIALFLLLASTNVVMIGFAVYAVLALVGIVVNFIYTEE